MASFATMGDSGDIDISDLLMVRRYTIERSRAQRLQNRAFMFAAEELRPPELQVLAMTIMPWFNPLEGNWGDDPEITFHSQVGESRSTPTTFPDLFPWWKADDQIIRSRRLDV